MAITTPLNYKPLLQSGTWFRQLPELLQDRMLAVSLLVPLVSGQRLYSAGDNPTGLYCVLEGGVTFSLGRTAGAETPIVVGEVLHWMAVVETVLDQKHVFSATAQRESLLLHVPKKAIDNSFKGELEFWRCMSKHLGVLLSASWHYIESKVHQGVEEQLANGWVVHSREAVGQGKVTYEHPDVHIVMAKDGDV